MVGVAPGGGTFHGAVTPSPILNRLCSSNVLNSWVLVWYHSSPESGFGESMSVATVYGTTLRSAPCSAHAGIGLLRSLPMTPSNSVPSSRPYRWPSTLSNERFSNNTTTTWSRAWDLSISGISRVLSGEWRALRVRGGRSPGQALVGSSTSRKRSPCAAPEPAVPPPGPRRTNPHGQQTAPQRGVRDRISPGRSGGDDGTRTHDPLLAKQML